MKKLNLTQLENVNGRWWWEKPVYPLEQLEKMNIGYIHRNFGGDVYVTEYKGGMPIKISRSDAKALVRYNIMGIIKPANCN